MSHCLFVDDNGVFLAQNPPLKVIVLSELERKTSAVHSLRFLEVTWRILTASEDELTLGASCTNAR